jgi:hypothetical protein
MGKLHLGEITEINNRLKAVEDVKVLKAFDAEGTSESDIVIVSDEE